MIKGRLRTYKTTDGGRLHRLVFVVQNEQTDGGPLHPITVMTSHVPHCEKGFVRTYERIRVKRSQTACMNEVYDRPAGTPAPTLISNRAILCRGAGPAKKPAGANGKRIDIRTKGSGV